MFMLSSANSLDLDLFRLILKNIVGKGENAGNQHFLLYPQCFPPFPYTFKFLSQFLLLLLSANSINLD